MAAILILVMNLRFLTELAVVLDHKSNSISSQQELCFVELLLAPNYFLVCLFHRVSLYVFIRHYLSYSRHLFSFFYKI